jgi:hypothetical protein
MLHYARRLPHWDAIGQPQFVTFRLHGSLPATRGFRREHVATSGEAFVTMDRLLDKGATGPLHLKRPDVAALVVERRCWTVMLSSFPWQSGWDP